MKALQKLQEEYHLFKITDDSIEEVDLDQILLNIEDESEFDGMDEISDDPLMDKDPETNKINQNIGKEYSTYNSNLDFINLQSDDIDEFENRYSEEDFLDSGEYPNQNYNKNIRSNLATDNSDFNDQDPDYFNVLDQDLTGLDFSDDIKELSGSGEEYSEEDFLDQNSIKDQYSEEDFLNSPQETTEEGSYSEEDFLQGNEEYQIEIRDENMDSDEEYDEQDFLGDEDSEPEDPNFVGTIRTVQGANLVFKRLNDNNLYDELWVTTVDKDMKEAAKIRRAVLAGTDINPANERSTLEDDDQYSETTSIGNVNFIRIYNLPN